MTDPANQIDHDGFSPPPRASIRRNVFHMLSSQLFTWVLATVMAVIVPRYVGPNIQGQLRLATSLWTIGGIFIVVGTSEFLRLEIARHPREGLDLIGSVIMIRSVAFLVTAIAIGVYVGLAESTHQFALIMLLTGTVTLIATWADVIDSAFTGLERMSVVAVVTAVAKVVLTVGVLAVIWMNGNVYGILGVGVLVAAGSLAQLLWRFRSITPIVLRGWRKPFRRIIKASAPFMAAGTALVIYQQIDVIVISWVAGKDALGWYSTADALFGSLLFPATIIMATIFPTLGRLHQDDPDAMVDLVERTFFLLVLASVPIGLGVTLVAPTFAPLLYGEAFRETGVVLAVIGPVVMLTFGTILFGAVALATGRNKIWVWVLLGAAALTVPLDLVLVPWADQRFENGAIGGALAYVVTESMQLVVGIWLIAPFLARRRTAWYVTRVLLAGGIMFAAGWPLRELPLPIPVAVCALVYVVAVLVFKVFRDDQRHMIGEMLARVGIRPSWVA